MSISANKKSLNYHNKHQYKLIVLISTLEYINTKYKKYTQKNILYFFNENLKRNGQATTTLRTLQKYLYRLEKDIKVTTNYYKHLGVNFGTEIYYHLNCKKNECHFKINQYFQEKKHSRFKSRVNSYLNTKSPKKGNVELRECLSNKNNNIKEEKRINQIEEYQVKNYYNKSNIKSKSFLSILNLDINKKTKIEVIKIIKRGELELIKSFNANLNRSCFKNKQKKLREILKNTQKQLEQNGYNNEQLETDLQKVYQTYKFKPHFIIENHKYKDLDIIKRKLEKSIKSKVENPQKDYENLKINIFNILVEQLKKDTNIEIVKPIIKEYLNNQRKIEYNKVFGTYYSELSELIKNQKKSLTIEEFYIKAV
ncbi:plasmid maintenance protein (plasmid) [Borreliella californiensis]|uniref:N-glycosylase/DNA lyase n=1 Tax=Borreliella californiensis TaxID=373543 RepID=A0A7W9ZLN2_9SPIR|nr:plasmid maintenance protein [Borreliella californiensis]MBB6213805.1 N-glycosylase/DNA lyase [Borreliella californiensis]